MKMSFTRTDHFSCWDLGEKESEGNEWLVFQLCMEGCSECKYLKLSDQEIFYPDSVEKLCHLILNSDYRKICFAFWRFSSTLCEINAFVPSSLLRCLCSVSVHKYYIPKNRNKLIISYLGYRLTAKQMV